MTHTQLISSSAVAVAALSVAAAAGAAQPPRLLFDADYTHSASAGPASGQVGHRQIVSGVLRDAAGHRLGTFHFACRTTRVLAGGDALERCNASATTADGQLHAAGPARSGAATQSWTITRGSGSYRRAHGSVFARDIGGRESLISVTVTTRPARVLRAGAIPAAATGPFPQRAQRLCAQAAERLDALPPFPFADFDPMHPDPAQLRQVGAFFTGPGDPRPILTTLDSGLQALGHPKVDAAAWSRLLHGRVAVLNVIDAQDRASLDADVPTFINSVTDSTTAFREVAIGATVFGTPRCVL